MNLAVPEREFQDHNYGPFYDDIKTEFRPDYSDLFEYHQWGHILSTEKRALGHLQRLETLGARNLPSRFSLGMAVVGHDAGMPVYFGLEAREGFSSTDFSCPEAYSIYLTANRLQSHKVDLATVGEIGEYQWTTKAGERIKSWGGMILCISDLGTAAGDYDSDFMPESPKLRRERLLAKGEKLTEAEYQDFTVWLLSKYAVRNLRGAESFASDIDPLVFFAHEISSIENNVKRLAIQRAAENHESVESYVMERGDDVPVLFGLEEAA